MSVDQSEQAFEPDTWLRQNLSVQQWQHDLLDRITGPADMAGAYALDVRAIAELSGHSQAEVISAVGSWVAGGLIDVHSSAWEGVIFQRARRHTRAAAEPIPVAPPRSPSPRRAKGSAQHRRLHVVAERDGWDCYLCGEPLADPCAQGGVMPRELHRWLPQIEHVVARALDGSNDLENLRLACWPCNGRKGAQ